MRLDHDFFCVDSLDTGKPGRWRGMLRFRKQTKKTDEEMEDDEELGVHIRVTRGNIFCHAYAFSIYTLSNLKVNESFIHQ